MAGTIDPQLTVSLQSPLGFGADGEGHAAITVERTRPTSKKHYGAWQSLKIQFKRTVRVAEDGNTNDLPPSLGTFPLYDTKSFATLPQAINAKGGYLFPMYRELKFLNRLSGAILNAVCRA